jgi:23S rRNA (cytosine1962-C5)-methyltransferase
MRQLAVREVVLSRRAAGESLLRGHPWVWADAIGKNNGVGEGQPAPGEEVQVLAPDGTPLGRGLADPGSPIAVRMWTRRRDPIDDALWRSRVAHALDLRAALFDGALGSRTNAMRLIHGEGDRIPGFVADRYASVTVVRTDGDGAAARLADFVQALWPRLARMGVKSLVHRSGKKGEPPRLERLEGDEPPETVRVEEHGVPFLVDLARGQKTGAFLDQRDNRRRVGELASGRRVLNLFSYAGGFSLHAALGGATHVTSVDVAAAAHATAQGSFQVAGVDPRAHTFVTADVQAFLDAARGRGETWDLVVSDPPSFAANERALPRALTAYRALHRACAGVLATGGIFCAASCSSHVHAEDFLSTLDDAALGGRALTVLELRGPGADHPVPAAFPEGRYLKFAVLA